MLPTTPAQPPRSSKRRSRLAVACNRCREAKVRCDVSQDACRRCRDKGYACVATDPRTGVTIPRRLARAALERHKNVSTPESSSYQIRAQSDEWGDPDFPTINDSTPGSTTHSEIEIPVTEAEPTEVGTGGTNDQVTQVLHISAGSPFSNMQNTPASSLPSEGDGLETAAVQNVGMGSRHAVLGSTNMQILAAGWIDRYFTQLGLPFRVSGCFKYGMRHAVEGGKPVHMQPWTRISPALHETYVKAYRQAIYPLLPIVDQVVFLDQESEGDAGQRAISLAVYSLGADALAGEITPVGTAYLYEAYSLVVDLLSHPYLSSVQALALISIAFWTRAKDGQASLTISLAIRMAQALGLHRNIEPPNIKNPEPGSHHPYTLSVFSSVWWSLYCLDIVSALDSGAPRVIDDACCDRPLPMPPEREAQCRLGGLFYFHAFVRLCCAISPMRLSLAMSNPDETDWKGRLFRETVNIDSALQAWYAGLPVEIRSGTLQSTLEEKTFASFLMLQYHQCVILAHRTALVTRDEIYSQEVQARFQPESPKYRQLLAGQSQCYTSAVEMIRIFNILVESKLARRLIPISRISYPAVIITIWILKRPMSSFEAVDMALLQVACNHAHNLYEKVGQDRSFSNGWAQWNSTISEYVRSRSGSRSGSMAQRSNNARGNNMTPSAEVSSGLNNSLVDRSGGEPRNDQLGSVPNAGLNGWDAGEVPRAGEPLDFDLWDFSTVFDVPVEIQLDLLSPGLHPPTS